MTETIQTVAKNRKGERFYGLCKKAAKKFMDTGEFGQKMEGTKRFQEMKPYQNKGMSRSVRQDFRE